MGQFFSNKTEEGLRLVWMQFNRDEIRRGKELLEQAGADGDPDALCFLAGIYMGALWEYAGLERDQEKAARILKESIRAGSACGILVALRCGEWTPSARCASPISPPEAWDAVARKAEDGHPFCQYLIGNGYYWMDRLTVTGEDPAAVYGSVKKAEAAMAQAALPWLERALAGGVPQAGYNLAAYCRRMGDRGAERRVVEACAALGAPDWLEQLGRLLYEEQPEEAFRLFIKAAEQGQITAWDCVGNACLTGTGAPRDAQKAFQSFLKGARGADPAAQCDLAWMYFEGAAAEPDAARAAYWAGKAAEAEPDAREYAFPLLAHCMLHGLGLARDVGSAVELLRRAGDFNISGEEGVFRYSDRDCRLLYRDVGEVCELGLVDGDVFPTQAVRAYKMAAEEFGDRESAKRLAHFQRGMFGKWKIK